MADSNELFAAARAIIPGGVNSPVRAFGAVGGTPRFIARARGSRLWDVEGREYIDFVGAWGPAILGHANEQVVAAVRQAAENGLSFGAPTAAETELARLVCQRMPSIEMLRLVNSGTEATMTAIRLARGFTGRERIIKFAGCYHGHADSFLIKAGSGLATFGTPTSPGVPPAIIQNTLVATFNDMASVSRLMATYPGSIAAVIVEPVMGNAGLIPPDEGFLTDLRMVTQKAGILLILDEVMTGFRLAPGGAQELYGIVPDLTTLGKIIGGGLPVGALGGRRDIMSKLAPAGPVYQAGTMSGNPLAVAAGLATLNQLTPDTYKQLAERAHQLETGIRQILAQRNLPWQYQRVGSMATLFFAKRPVRDFDDALASDTAAFARFFHALLEHGIYLPPAQFEAFFLSAAHTAGDIETTLSAITKAL